MKITTNRKYYILSDCKTCNTIITRTIIINKTFKYCLNIIIH